MFDAAHAALLWSGATINPAAIKTHSGLIAAFGQHLVKPGHLPGELGKSLNQVERIRLLADYTGEEVTNESARWAVEIVKLLLSPREKRGRGRYVCAVFVGDIVVEWR